MPLPNSDASTSADPSSVDVARVVVQTALREQWEKLIRNLTPENLLAVIQHWHLWQPAQRAVLKSKELDFSQAIRAALCDSDLQIKHNAFDAIADLEVVALTPDLIKLAMQPSYVHRSTSSAVLLRLVAALYAQNQKINEASQRDRAAELLGLSAERVNESQQLAPPPVFKWPSGAPKLRQIMEAALQHYKLGGRSEVLTVYLTFADYDDILLDRILSDKMHPAHDDMVELLEHSEVEAVVEKLASFLFLSRPLPCITSIWRRRNDLLFLRRFLQVIGRNEQPEVVSNLRRLQQPFWLGELISDISGLHLAEQFALLNLIQNCLPYEDEALDALHLIMQQASMVLKRRIVAMITQVSGMRANQMVGELLDRETDAEILMLLIPELRRRNLARAMKRLLNLLDHGHEGVRRKAAEAFHDCTIQRYLAAYDLLEDPVRRSTGQLVLKVDPATNRVLAEELSSGNRIRQVRALHAIRSIGNVDELFGLVSKTAQNPDVKLKVASIGTLAGSLQPEAKGLIRRFLVDENPAVRKAAELALDVTPEIFGDSTSE